MPCVCNWQHQEDAVASVSESSSRPKPTRAPRADLMTCVLIFVLALLSCPSPSSDTTPRGRSSYRRFNVSSAPVQTPSSRDATYNDTLNTLHPEFLQSPMTTNPSTVPSQRCDSETTVIITSNLIPTHPKLAIINDTIASVHRYAQGLCPTAPLVITVDGLVPQKAKREVERERWRQYIQNLQETFGKQVNVTILVSQENIHLGGSLLNAMTQAVKTRYVLVVQHDLPFIRPINFWAVREAMQAHPDDLSLVRFNSRKNEKRLHENHTCWGQIHDQPYSPFTASDGITVVNFTRTPLWSDRNHLTTVDYYKQVFVLLLQEWGHVHGFPERVMVNYGLANCSYFGTHLYGPENFDSVVQHSNGRLFQP